eukprot:TRINITY_DN5177_c0_g1_i3.p3 TRINITY_DN5177_c0_g1~~TRINITY_DN5177_c0_g1_i3.p3  ORF type:complete len:108 (+),score=22.19 TRINITY_DN5177_c0_g1_i3:51-374(+)
MRRRPPRSTQGVSSAASDVYKRQEYNVSERKRYNNYQEMDKLKSFSNFHRIGEKLCIGNETDAGNKSLLEDNVRLSDCWKGARAYFSFCIAFWLTWLGLRVFENWSG